MNLQSASKEPLREPLTSCCCGDASTSDSLRRFAIHLLLLLASALPPLLLLQLFGLVELLRADARQRHGLQVHHRLP